MNQISRLTALLLALVMLLGSVSLAEGGLPIGGASGLTSDDWASLVEQAEEELFFIDEGATGQVVIPESPEQPEKSEFHPYTDVEEITLIQSDASAEAAITASGVAILSCAEAGQWQINLGGSWVSLTGETGASLTVTSAMMNGQSAAEIRKALGAKDAETGEYAAFTQTAVINIIDNTPAMFSVSRDAEGTGDASDANDGIMTLELANQDNMVVVQVIYCIKDSKLPVADPYIGQIAKGSALSTTLTLPRVAGYLATNSSIEPAELEDDNITVFTGQTAEMAGSLAINVTEEQSVEDITIYVEYEPTDVNFVVKHFLQNVDNDGYTLELEEKDKTGLTGAPVGAGHELTAKAEDPLVGFSAIWYDPTTAIAADGSTVVEIYYNREYYLMTFDLGGGYGVEPVFARYGATVSVEEPERAGYAFKGWSVDGTSEEELPSAIPAENCKYTALWEAADTTYTVVYWRADVDDGDDTTPTTYSYWGYETVNSLSGMVLTPSEVGSQYPAANVEMIVKDNEAGYFTYDEAATVAKNEKTPTVVVAGDGTSVVNVYYSRNEYTIRFVYTRKSGDKYYFASSTGCGTYNNRNHSAGYHQSTGYDEKAINWSYSSKEKPVVTEGFTTGTFDEVDGTETYTYYYISLTAEYGANLEKVWPAAPLQKVDNSYDFGSWAVQCGSPYRIKYGNEHSNIVGAYPVMSSDLIIDPANKNAQTMVAWWGKSSDNVSVHTYHIYFEALPGERIDAEYTDNVTRQYVRMPDSVFTCAHNSNTRVDPFAYAGFECVNDTRDTRNDYQANSSNYAQNNNNLNLCPNKGTDAACDYCQVFYYKRNEYTLSFYNYNDASQTTAPGSQTLMFGESFTDHDPGVPEYPEGAEPGSLQFVGWYTTPEAFEGTEVDWANGTMPAGDLTFYAKWELVTHDVSFWIDKGSVGSEDADKKVVYYEDITHGMTIGNAYPDEEHYIAPQEFLEQHQEYKDYTFDGWYFTDEDGTEMRFDIDTLPIRSDLDIYAKWTSNEPVEFTFYFQHEDGTQLAEDYTGQALPGTPVTLNAKIGDELTLAPKQDDLLGYIPYVNSHTITLDVDATKNVFTFVYVQPAKVSYTVQYLAAKYEEIDGKQVLVPIEGAAPLAAEKTGETTNAIVTENYVPVLGYMPQATQLRLIVSMDESMNVLQFLYVRNDGKALYNATHYIVDHEGQTREYSSEKNMQGTINEKVEVTKQSITGYQFSHAKVEETKLNDKNEWVTELVDAEETSGDTVQHTLTDGGMHVKLYYSPVECPYIVHHLDAADGSQRAESTTDTALYGSTLTTSTYVKEIEGYRVSSMTPAEIRVDVEEDTTPAKNVMYIYYEPDVADITISKQIRVSPEADAPQPSPEERATDFAFTVTLTGRDGKALETVSVSFNGEAQGSRPLTNGVLTFQLQHGQMMTIHDLPVGTQYTITEAETATFKTSYSTQTAGTLTMLDVDMIVTNMYPKYAGELTIKKDGLQDDKESAIVHVTVGGDDYYLVLNASNGYTATISGLKPGTTYSVSEVTAWTWQYGDVQPVSGELTETNPTATVTITNTPKADKWLHDESHVENDFGTEKSTGVNN